MPVTVPVRAGSKVFAIIKRLLAYPDYEWVDEFPRGRNVVESGVTGTTQADFSKSKLLIFSVVREIALSR